VASDIEFVRIFLELFTLVLSTHTQGGRSVFVWAEIGSNIADNFQLYSCCANHLYSETVSEN